jgi:copper(I)-binding protein
MLMGPTRPVRAGDSCRIVLEFGDGQELAVDFEVRGL